MPTQLEFDVLKSKSRIMHGKFNLLNYNFQQVGNFNAVVLEGSTFKNDATSDLRRSCSISLIPTDSSFDISNGNKIWLDKYIQPYIGIDKVNFDGSVETVWFNMGIYLINNPSRDYDATNNTMTIDCVDLMTKMTGLRNGNLTGMPYSIPAGSNVRTAILAVLALGGFTKYVVDECTIITPNVINIDVGGTLYDILKALRDIIPQYQIYFDVDGIFHYNLIPSGANEQIAIDDSLFKPLLKGYNINISFEDIKNEIEVIGKTHDISNYGTATISGSTYMLSIASVITLYDQLKIGFTAPSQITTPYINLNSIGAIPLVDEYGVAAVLESGTNIYYVAKYQLSSNTWLFMGEVTPSAIVQEINPDSPFYINGTLKIIRKVCSGGDYDNIYMSSLAQARAKWELYNYCRVQDNITITCLPIFFADVNTIISITLPNKQGTETTDLYIIKQIDTTFAKDGLQTITAMKYYSYYETG